MKETATAFNSNYTVGFCGKLYIMQKAETEAFAIFVLLLFFALWRDMRHILEIRSNDGSTLLKV